MTEVWAEPGIVGKYTLSVRGLLSLRVRRALASAFSAAGTRVAEEGEDVTL